jgi:hypothetical protein
VKELRGTPVVVANFGLLSERNDGWLLTCEESIGGLLLATGGDETVGLASTEAGVFERAASLCEWDQGPALVSNGWALRFSLALVPSGGARERFALVIDRETQQLVIERATQDQDFSVVHSFDSLSGYRQLVSGGNPAGIFVSGYTLNPRTWHLAYSLDSGDTWRETTPSVDNETATMVLRLVDPEAPNVLLFQAETTPGMGNEIWRFDAADETSERVLVLDEGEVFGGVTFNGTDLWVAGRRRGTGADPDRQQARRGVRGEGVWYRTCGRGSSARRRRGDRHVEAQSSAQRRRRQPSGMGSAGRAQPRSVAPDGTPWRAFRSRSQ